MAYAKNNVKRATHGPRHAMLGMSLVEILAAMLIGLIGMTVIMQVFSVSESRKRTTTGSSDAQISGNLSIFALERDLRNAGYGMISSDNNMLGCTTVAYDNTRSVPDFNFTMAPVLITDGAAGAPDEITVIYGNGSQMVDGTDFAAAATTVADFPLGNAAGFRVGDIAVASDLAAGVNCAMVEVTGFVAAAPNTIEHVNGGIYTYTNNFGFPVTATATRNKPGGVNVGGAFTQNARLFLLGRQPTVTTYVTQNDRLQTKTLVPFDATQDPDNDDLSEAELADGIVQLQAQYGMDDGVNNGTLARPVYLADDGIVDNFIDTLPAVPTVVQWMRVRAIRFALVVRSQHLEETAVTAGLPGTAPAPSWAGGAIAMTNPADGTNWRNYRYRVYQKVVPLRNMIWSTDP